MKYFRRIFPAATLLAISCALASAATVTFGPFNVPQQSAGSGFSTIVNVNQFDASLGTLTGIQITATANFLVNFTVTNNTGGAGTFRNAHGTGSINVTGPAALNVALSGSTPNQGSVVSPDRKS